MTVNILPTRTWNRLGMNESQIQIEWPEESVLIKPERLAAGVTWEKEISGKEWDEIQTGMGREYDAMAAECGTAGANRTDTVNGTAVTEENAGAGSIYRLTAEAAAVLQNENTEWTVLCVDTKTAVTRTASPGCKGKQPLKRADRIPLRGGRTGNILVPGKGPCGKECKGTASGSAASRRRIYLPE